MSRIKRVGSDEEPWWHLITDRSNHLLCGRAAALSDYREMVKRHEAQQGMKPRPLFPTERRVARARLVLANWQFWMDHGRVPSDPPKRKKNEQDEQTPAARAAGQAGQGGNQ